MAVSFSKRNSLTASAVSRSVAIAAWVFLVAWASSTVVAQSPQPVRPGSVRLTVRDATKLPVAGARVALTLEGSARDAITNESGVATFDNVAPAVYTVSVESPGFEPFSASDLNVRSGARVTRDVELVIAGLIEAVDVTPSQDAQDQANAFATELSAEEIASLPEDPDELAEMLAQLAGLDAEIRVDGFADGVLPPGTQIQSVRIRYDAASAGSSSGGPRIEIRTQPGGDRWRGNTSMRVRDETLNARNAFSAVRPSGQTRQYSWSLNGPLVRDKTGLSINLERSDAIEQRAIRAAGPGGLFSALVRQPTNRLGISTRLEHALSPAQRLRVDFRQSGQTAANQGLGEFDLPERAFQREDADGELRLGHNYTIGREAVHDFRIQTRWRSTTSTPASTGTAIRVPGAFAEGGAQVQGGRRTREIEIEDELMFTYRQRHQVTIGANVIGAHFEGDEWRNAGGTFTFASVEDLGAERPTSFTQRTGDPSFRYSLYRFGAFVQENYQVRRNLMFNLGVRHESQTHLRDWANFAPRVGVNWTPSPRARTALRASFGISFQPLQGSTYEQTLLVNGERQRELILIAPSFPDPFLDGVTAAARAPGIIRAARDLRMPSTRRLAFGIDQPIGRAARLRFSYTRQKSRDLFRSLDANAPIDGVRPNAAARTITELESTARSVSHSLETNFTLNLRPHRLTLNTTYTLGQQQNEADGALQLPPNSFRLDTEWGPSRQDIRHRWDASAAGELWWGFRLNGTVRTQSATPYTITTGLDLNGDGINNERPEGVNRNTARGAGTRTVDMTLTWGVGVGQREAPQVPRGGGRVGQLLAAAANRPQPKVRVEIYVQGNNVLNDVNPQGFSGVQTSPFFGRATSASPARRLSIGARANF